MILIPFLGAIALLLAWFFICAPHDFPEFYARTKGRMQSLMAAVTVASMLVWASIVLMPIGCGDVEEYSALWYLFLCMGHSH